MLNEMKQFAGTLPEHLQAYWTPDIETQVNFADGRKFRVPKNGKEDPYYNDHSYHPEFNADNVAEFGTSGWDWQNQRSLFGRIDLDALDHVKGLDPKTIEGLVQSLSTLEEVEITRSTGGLGYHLTVYFDPEDAPRADTRADHIGNIKQVAAYLSTLLTIDLTTNADAIGVICWLHNHRRREGGYDLVKKSTKFLGREWRKPIDTSFFDEPLDSLPTTPTHNNVADWLIANGMGEWDGERFRTHTYNLLLASQEPSLKIKGGFATIATGKDGPGSRNCWMCPGPNGSWKVYRYHQGTPEHESWWKSAAGWTTTTFNKQAKDSVDPAMLLVSIGTADELFRDSLGTPFVTTTIHGVKETMPVTDGRFKAKLRLEFTGKTGSVVSKKILDCALSQLEAIATLERPEFPVSVRIAEHDGDIYIDLANHDRQMIKITAAEWKVVRSAPVRFVRPYGMLPLPIPLPGGKLDDLKKCVNVDDDDLPLLLAFIVSCFHPSGPYALLSILGEQGSAKTSLLRFLHDFIDPQMSKGATLPSNERDLLVAAQYRRLVSFDNVDKLDRKISSLLCMLCTGASSANRKLFTDADQSILVAKRPVVLTSIADVVTADDLLDRTISLLLPVIPTGERRTEFAIDSDLRKDGTRGKILGFILNGVVAALAGHDKIRRSDLPRMADVFTWALAAEETYGCGSTLDAYKARQSESIDLSLNESPFAERIIKLCETGFSGKASDIAKQLKLGMSYREVGSELRSIAPSLRSKGFVVAFSKSNKSRVITLGRTG